MDNRGVFLLIYGAVLGWCAHTWWRRQRERLAWEAVAKLRETLAYEEALNHPESADEPTT